MVGSYTVICIISWHLLSVLVSFHHYNNYLRQWTYKEKDLLWLTVWEPSVHDWLAPCLGFVLKHHIMAGIAGRATWLSSWPEIKRYQGGGEGPTIPFSTMASVNARISARLSSSLLIGRGVDYISSSSTVLLGLQRTQLRRDRTASPKSPVVKLRLGSKCIWLLSLVKVLCYFLCVLCKLICPCFSF